MAGVLAVVLMVGSSAQAGRHRDYNRDYRDYSHYRTHTHYSGCGHKSNDEPAPGPSVPEPSAALVFGVGLLVARGFARRNR
jgi:hypothetical protein